MPRNDLNHRTGAILESHYVYVMLCQDGDGPGYVKFGMSMQPTKRLQAIRVGCPIPARYFAVCEVGAKATAEKLERELHLQFEDRRLKGEWFAFDFSSKEDKESFNYGCRVAFWKVVGPEANWIKISAHELDVYHAERRRAFLVKKRGSALRRWNAAKKAQTELRSGT